MKDVSLTPAVATALACTGAVALAILGDPRAHAYVATAIMLAWALVLALRPTGAGFVRAAVLVRLPLLFVEPTLSDDVHRYVWEGRVLAAGFSPFAHAPDATTLAHLRDANWALVNHREVSSVYPPVAMGLFWLLAPGGVLAWRIVSAAADVATVWLLGRRNGAAGWTWALLPLPAVESAVSGHLEGIGVLCLVAAMGGREWAAWLGGMVKLLPGVLLLRSRWSFAWGALSALALLPFVGPGLTRGMGSYAGTWSYNGSIWPVADAIVGEAARPALMVVGAILVALALREDRGRLALWTTGAFVCLSPTVHPWYVLWPLAAGLWVGVRAWTLLAALIPLSYVVLASYDPITSSWTESWWPRWVVYPPFYAMLAWEGWRRLTRAGP